MCAALYPVASGETQGQLLLFETSAARLLHLHSSKIPAWYLRHARKSEPELPSFSDARHLVEQYASTLSPTQPEMMPLLEAIGLVLAEDLRADRDFPPFPRSTRDGFAVRAADVKLCPPGCDALVRSRLVLR